MSSPHFPQKNRACEACARAKAKCVWADKQKNGEKLCERCFRGDFVCRVPPLAPRRKRGKSTRVKAIEQKLDGIMDLLDKNRHLIINEAAEPPEQQNPPLARQASTNFPISPAMSDVHHTNVSTPRIYLTTEEQQLHEQVFEIMLGFSMSHWDAEQVLQEYRSTMLPQFPFVPLRTTRVAEMIHQPILLKVILYACRPPPQHLRDGFEKWFRQYVAHEIVVAGSRKLELLQAILIFLAWKDFRYFVDARHTSLLQLAAGLVSDAGLSTSPDNPGLIPRSFVEDATMIHNFAQRKEQHTSAERRAVLGLFYITSSISLLLSKAPCLGYSAYFEECCQSLLRAQEHMTDDFLVQLVRVTHIAAKMNKLFQETANSIHWAPQRNFHAMTMPLIKKELDDWMDKVPSELKSNHMLQSHYHAILIRLFEPAIQIPSADWPGPPLSRAQGIWDCFQNARDLCQSFLANPSANLSRATFAVTAHLALSIIKMTRLLRAEDPDWDTPTAAKIARIEDLLQQISEHFEEASRVGGPRRTVIYDEQDLLMRYAERIRMLKKWCSQNLVPASPPQPSTDAEASAPDMLANTSLDQLGDFEFWQMLSNCDFSYETSL